MRSQLDLLIGNKRRLIVSLSVLSILSGVTEAATLAIVAQVAATLVKGKGVHGKTGLFDVHASVGTLLWIGLALTLLRLFLQWPLSVLPARIAADVQMSLRTRDLPSLYARLLGVQSRDREGQLQEIMTSQTSQATGGALQATSVLSSSLTFVILMGSAVALSPPAARHRVRHRDRDLHAAAADALARHAGAAANCPRPRCDMPAGSPRPTVSPKRARSSG